jgi:hypothetical protein
LIDPLTAQSKAEPLVPAFSRERRGRWLAPVPVGTSTVALADEAGKARLLMQRREPIPRLEVEAEKQLEKGIIADPSATAQAVILATSDQRVRVLSARDLSPIGAWPLAAPILGSPKAVEDRCFVYDSGGGVLALDRDGQRHWSIKLQAPACGTPLIQGQRVWLLDREGRLHARLLADGSALEQRDLGVFPCGGPLSIGREALIPTARGTVQLTLLQPESTRDDKAPKVQASP